MLHHFDDDNSLERDIAFVDSLLGGLALEGAIDTSHTALSKMIDDDVIFKMQHRTLRSSHTPKPFCLAQILNPRLQKPFGIRRLQIDF